MKKQLFALTVSLLAAGLSAQSPRMVLFEEFTGENCGPCAAANPALNNLLDQAINKTRVAAIKWEVPIPSAPSPTWSLYKTNKAEIDWRYRGWNGATSSQVLNGPTANGYGYPSAWQPTTTPVTSGVNSAPQGRLDGQYQWTFGAASNHVANLNNTVIGNAAAVPSPFTINMTRTWNFDASAIVVNVTVTASQNFTANGPLVFRTVMVERSIQFATAPGTNGEKTFKDVGIKSFPNLQNGTPLQSSWTTGQSQTFSLSCTIPTYVRKKTEIGFVGFIQDDGDRTVQQAFRLDKEGFPYDAAALAPVVPPVCSSQLNAVVTVENKGLNAITAMTITPYTGNTAANITQWTGNLLPNTTTTIALDPISLSLPSGPHTFSYNISAVAGNDIEINNNSNSTTFLVASAFSGAPVVEGFVGSFPPAAWTVIDPNSSKGWQHNTTVGGYNLSTESMMVPFYTNTNIGEVEEIILPPVNLKGNADPILDFLYAYAKRVNASNDQLEILVSKDCGNNWTSVFSRSGDVLKSEINPVAVSFVPQAQQWRQESITLTGFNADAVLVKFRATNDNGNNLYVDDINLRQDSPTTGLSENSGQLSASVFPNPAHGLLTLKVSGAHAGSAKLQVWNSIGQIVQERDVNLSAGTTELGVDLSGAAKGVYHLKLVQDNQSLNKLISIQ